uniref:nephrin n=1 Tax=Pristiophorus japonicus TaxID=55135 RepID=UPI00398EBCB7
MKPGPLAWSGYLLYLCIISGSGMRQMFRKHPENTSSIEGATSVLRCEVEGLTGPVQWEKDGLLLGPGRKFPGFPRYSVTGSLAAGVFDLRMKAVGLEDDASYQCQVGRSESSPGIISRTAWLEVLIPPCVPTIENLDTQSPVTWIAGEEYSLTCHARDSKPASTIFFTKSGVELSGSETTVNPGSKDKLFSTVSIIRIIPQSSDNGNEMLCGASNVALTQPRTSGFTMNVLFPPQMPRVEGYDRHQVKAGETLQLVCSSSGGNPLATLQWLKDETVLSTTWETEERRRSARSVLTYPVTPEDNAVKLTCEAMNQVTATPLRTVIILHVVFAPVSVKIVGSTRALENKQISLSCSTSASNPPAKVRWRASGKQLNITEATYTQAVDGGVTTVSNVTLTATRVNDGMSIVCEALNEAVFVTKSASAVIKVHYPPERIWIEGPAETLPFQAGAEVTLSCFASGGNPPPRFSWKKGSKPVSSGIYRSTGNLASSVLTIATEPSDNLAKYQCRATNEAALAPLTAVGRISVQFAPIDMVITTSAVEVRWGELITLMCLVGSSNPVAHVAWIKDGIRWPADDVKTQPAEYGGQSRSARMTMVAASADNGKRVTCEARSPVQQEALNIFHTLNVLHPPEFLVTQVQSVLGEERGSVTIPVSMFANPPKVNYTWSRNGALLVKDGPTRHHLKSDGSLEIWNLRRDDAGFYRVQLRNEEGESEMLLKLDVLYSPRIHGVLDHTEVDLGGSVEMVCAADANPVISKMVTWMSMDEGREVSEEDQIFMGNTTKLVLRGAERRDSGRYACRADNGIAPPDSASTQLIVRFKPELQKGVELSKVAVVGDGTSAAILICKAEGVPNVVFSWAKNGVSLEPENPRYLQSTFQEGPLHTSWLTMANATAALDYATFTCTAQNPLGIDLFDIQLVRTSRPDPPTGLKILSKTHNSVTLAWRAGFDGGLEQRFQVRYIWTEAKGYLYVGVYPPQATIFTITGLRPRTPYNFSINALNALGAGDYVDQGLGLTVITSGKPERDPFPTASLLAPDPGSGKDTATSGRVKRLTLNDYGDELVNTNTKQTLLIDTESDRSYRTYESYDGSTSLSGALGRVGRQFSCEGVSGFAEYDEPFELWGELV